MGGVSIEKEQSKERRRPLKILASKYLLIQGEPGVYGVIRLPDNTTGCAE